MEDQSKEIERLRLQVKNLEKLSSLGMLSAGIAHEIQNPLNFVINFSKLSSKLVDDLEDILEEEKEVFIGIGTKPACCNHGYGQQMLQIAYENSKKLYSAKPLYLEVRNWNKRAIRCYEKAGFVIDGSPYQLETSIGLGTFYRMIRK